MVLKFYASVAKGLKLKVKMFWWLIPTFVEVTGEKPVGTAFLLPPSWIRLKWLISLSNNFFGEQMTWAVKTNVLNVPRFHAFGTNDVNVIWYRYWWIYAVQWPQGCYHSSRSRCQGRKFFHEFFTPKWMKSSRDTSL